MYNTMFNANNLRSLLLVFSLLIPSFTHAMHEEDTIDYFSLLPDELLEEMFLKNLDFSEPMPDELKALMRVNHRFNRILTPVFKKFKLNKVDKSGKSPLFNAIAEGNINKLAELINNGANVNQRCTIEIKSKVSLINNNNVPGFTYITEHATISPLQFVIEQNARDIIDTNIANTMITLLLERGTDINQQDDLGETALHTAIQFLNIDFVTMLLEKGASVSIENNDGDNALQIAQKRSKNIGFKNYSEKKNIIQEIIKLLTPNN